MDGKVEAWVKVRRVRAKVVCAAELVAKEKMVVKLAGGPARAVKAELEARVDTVGRAANAAWYPELRQDNLDSRNKTLREGIWPHLYPTIA